MLEREDVANLALSHMGEARITSLEDNNKRANTIDGVYESCALELLEMFNWNFAAARASLPLLASVPAGTQYSLAYELPADCLRVRSIEQWRDGYKREGRTLLINKAAPVVLLYTKRTTSQGEWSVAACQALGLRIAVQTAFAITGNQEISDRVERRWKDFIRDAAWVSRTEESTEEWDVDVWLTSRYGASLTS